MRAIKRIFVHCTASSQQTTTEKKLWDEFRRKGWKNPGYHLVVKPDGNIIRMLDDARVSNGVKGYNQNAINVAYIGGIDAKGRDLSPDRNHNGVVDPWERIKECPCFDAMTEYMDINRIL